ncbi:hypothetical protein AC1031_009354 [Aphanomyces cochlioides]|nr:hypothetical protein AC1031_009354 [Aphanomyces cochlioides]
MILNTNTSVEALGRNWETIYIGSTTTVGGDIVRASIGPFMSWDTKLVTPPSSLLNVIAKFHAQLYDRLQSDLSLSENFQAISESDIDVVPPTWGGRNMQYFGGNPMCALVAPPQSFIHLPFSYQDSCQRQERFAITFSRLGVLFSMWITQLQNLSTIRSTCGLSLLSANLCNNIFGVTAPLLSKLMNPPNLTTLVQEFNNSTFYSFSWRLKI